MMVRTHRHLEYARGYLELGLINEAAEEIEAISGDDRLSFDVLRFRVDLYFAAKQWDMVAAVAKPVCAATEADDQAWIAWAFALRELGQIKEARDVLLKAEPRYGKSCSNLHYNLACYYSLLGDISQARRRLEVACGMDKHWQAPAVDDPDLKAMWESFSPEA
jgi:tetratricopeptide (TPR) repeat protein